MPTCQLALSRPHTVSVLPWRFCSTPCFYSSLRSSTSCAPLRHSTPMPCLCAPLRSSTSCTLARCHGVQLHALLSLPLHSWQPWILNYTVCVSQASLKRENCNALCYYSINNLCHGSPNKLCHGNSMSISLGALRQQDGKNIPWARELDICKATPYIRRRDCRRWPLMLLQRRASWQFCWRKGNNWSN